MDCKTSHDYCIRKLVIIPVNYDDLIIHCSFITMSKDDIVAYIYIQIYWYVLYVYDYINILIPHHYESPCRMRKIRDLEIISREDESWHVMIPIVAHIISPAWEDPHLWIIRQKQNIATHKWDLNPMEFLFLNNVQTPCHALKNCL